MQHQQRYMVFKLTDIDQYLDEHRRNLLAFADSEIRYQRSLDGKMPLQAVVVEHDWPMYHATWRAIEAWVDSPQDGRASMTLLSKVQRYFWNLLISLDQLANTILGGDPDETISSRTAKRVQDQRWAYWLCRALHWFDKDHCENSREHDRGSREVIR